MSNLQRYSSYGTSAPPRDAIEKLLLLPYNNIYWLEGLSVLKRGHRPQDYIREPSFRILSLSALSRRNQCETEGPNSEEYILRF